MASAAQHYFENCIRRIVTDEEPWNGKSGKYRDTNIDYLSEDSVDALLDAVYYLVFDLFHGDIEMLKILWDNDKIEIRKI